MTMHACKDSEEVSWAKRFVKGPLKLYLSYDALLKAKKLFPFFLILFGRQLLNSSHICNASNHHRTTI